MPLEKGQVLGEWRLQEQIGAGGQGSVWKARYTQSKHSPPGALKICTSRDPAARQRFLNEARLLREAPEHANIIRLRAEGEYDGDPFLVLEFANTSFDRLQTRETAGVRILQESPALLLRFFEEACRGVEHLHANSILHRDIKPHNILLILDPPEPMRCVVADLGISAYEHEQGKITKVHERVGTPEFQAPEAFRGKHTTRSDVYSLGKVLEFLFTGGVVAAHGPGKCTRTPAIGNDLWDELDRVLARACAHDPDDRYADAGELRQNLPTVLVTTATATVVGDSPGTPDDLTAAEWAVMEAILGVCPMTGDSVPGHRVDREVREFSSARVSAAIRSLLGHGLLVEVEEPGSNFGTYTALQLSPLGNDWVVKHQDKLDPVVPGSKPSGFDEAGGFGDDEIPF